ncbi:MULTISPECIES: hypothetical protein [unclassified Mesorhizobium]|uniref:hypothetical protein n=1 Tax=unclassified Mesorhizobium TaxID=325217 RepID=UPI0013E34EF1|nr:MULTISPECIES: hypothetical protein [unclassified Mesorhizobium]
MSTGQFTREEIQETTRNAVLAFYRAFERAPTETEQALLVACLTRFFIAPDAPSNRLQ